MYWGTRALGRRANLLAKTEALITLFGDAKLDTLGLGQTDPLLATLTNDKDVGKASGKGLVTSILKMHDIKTTRVTFTVGDRTNATHAVSSSDHGNAANFKLGESLNLARFQVYADSVVNVDQGIRIADGAAVVSDDKGNSLKTNLELLNLAELVAGLLIRNAVDDKATLGVVQDAEILSSLLNLDNI